MSTPEGHSTEQAMASLAASESFFNGDRFRALVLATSQIIWITDAVGNMITDMQSWCAFTGQTEAEARGKGGLLVIHPDDQPLVTTAWEESFANKTIFEREYRIRRFDGRYRHMLVRATPLLDAEGNVREWIGACTDITERKEQEQHNHIALAVLLRVAALVTEHPAQGTVETLLMHISATLFELASIDLAYAVQFDDDLRLKPLALYGASSADVTRWKAKISAFDVHSYAGFDAIYERLLNGQPFLQKFEHDRPFVTPFLVTDLHLREAVTIPITLNNRVLGWLTMARIATNLDGQNAVFAPWEIELLTSVGKLASEALQHQQLSDQLLSAQTAQLVAETTTKERDAFIGIVSHELRTPLTSLMVNAQLISRILAQNVSESLSAEKTTRIRELVERSTRQFHRLDRLVGDLLDVARITAGKLELHEAQCDLVMIVCDAIDEQRDAWPDRHIVFDAPPDAKLLVLGDSDRLGQVVTNLLTNAIKYAPATTPIAVQLRIRHGMVRVSVRDHGPGIPIKQQSQLFTRFYRVPGIEQQNGSGIGLGLGLSICKTIIEQHHGTIGVSSRVGAGSTFWFTLPLAE